MFMEEYHGEKSVLAKTHKAASVKSPPACSMMLFEQCSVEGRMRGHFGKDKGKKWGLGHHPDLKVIPHPQSFFWILAHQRSV